MSDEDKRSCFTCNHRAVCALKRAVRDALLAEAPFLKGAPRSRTDILDTLAEACNQYQKIEQEATSE